MTRVAPSPRPTRVPGVAGRACGSMSGQLVVVDQALSFHYAGGLLALELGRR
ncbi:MAG: hypothetical protein JWR13_1339 [Mycobacterium sp.]|jgi:hypothetical protein|nr:hypothetical protein [Mycobacterium sp.]MDT5313057.1 hypothetical protein [Mycobacterium sp.]